jgi:tetratricopeptide (TPR) repeat protein
MSRGLRTRIGLALVLGLLVTTACSDESPKGETPGAGAALEAALEAHAQGRLDEAIELYQQVLVLDPQNKFAYYNLGLIDQTQGRIDAASEEYQQALAVDPEFAPAMFNLAIVRSEQGNVDGAIGLYRRVIEVNPDDAAAHLNLGLLLLQNGQRSEGEAELAKAVELDPALESRIPDGAVVVGGATGP